MPMIRTGILALILALAGLPAMAEQPIQATLYKSPECTCCDEYAQYLRRNGFQVRIVTVQNLTPFKKEKGIPEQLESCHTTVIDGYAIEGHVPIHPIRKLLSERPAIKGISLPDMPAGSPGMGGRKSAPFVIYEISAGEKRVYAVE